MRSVRSVEIQILPGKSKKSQLDMTKDRSSLLLYLLGRVNLRLSLRNLLGPSILYLLSLGMFGAVLADFFIML